MTVFAYTVSDKNGKVAKGEIAAVSRKVALDQLRRRNLLVVNLKEQRDGLSFWRRLLSEPKIAELDKVMFIKHLSILTRAGLTLTEALTVLGKQPPSIKMKSIIESLLKDVEGGKNLADSMRSHPKNFSGFIVSMVEVGEKSGTLDKSLEYLSEQLQKNHELKKKVQGAMVYPIVILSFIVLLAAGLVGFILPRIIPMFESLNVPLPMPTLILMKTMKFLGEHGLLVGICAAVAIFIFVTILKMQALRPFWHKLLLKLPFFGDFSSDLNLTKFNHTLEAMLKSGTPIVRSLDVAQGVLSNEQYRIAVRIVIEEVEKGSALAAALMQRGTLFPVLMTAMIQVGEASGTLEEILKYLGGFYDKRVDAATKGLAAVVGPLLLVIMGVLVGGIALAIVMPIYQLPGSVIR